MHSTNVLFSDLPFRYTFVNKVLMSVWGVYVEAENICEQSLVLSFATPESTQTSLASSASSTPSSSPSSSSRPTLHLEFEFRSDVLSGVEIQRVKTAKVSLPTGKKAPSL